MSCEDFAPQGYHEPLSLSLSHWLKTYGEGRPDAPALLAPGRMPLTYGDLWKHVVHVVRTLHAMELGRHDRIALVLPEGPEMAVAFLATTTAAACAPLNPAYTADEFAFYLTDLRARAVIVQQGLDSPARTVAQAHGLRVIELRPLVEAPAGLFDLTSEGPAHARHEAFAQPGDTALVLHTSGTTSRPKMVPLTHVNLATSADNMRTVFELTEDDRYLNVMPLFHLHGLKAILASLLSGGSTVCAPGFSASQFYAWLTAFRPTWYTAAPAIHQAIVEYPDVHHENLESCSLRLIRSGSAALPSPVRGRLESLFRAHVIETFGLTEASGHITCNPPPSREWKKGAAGVPMAAELAIMDDKGNLLPDGDIGEIVARGPAVMQGYDNDAEANQHAFNHGWFRSGDQGYFDSDGYLFVTGRLKEIINRGGEKIAPREIDDVLMAHPAVAQAVTFAVPHVRLGEDVAAAVVLHPGAAETDRGIRTFAAQHLTMAKVPSRVLIVDDLPKGPTGKVQRLDLADQFGLTTPQPIPAGNDVNAAGHLTPVAETISEFWTELLGCGDIGRHDNFFELGGDSLLSKQLMTRIREAMHIEIPLTRFFELPTVAGLTEYIELCQWVNQSQQDASHTAEDHQEEGVL